MSTDPARRVTTLQLSVDGNLGTPIINTPLHVLVSAEANYRVRVGTILARDGRNLTVEVDTSRPEGRAAAAQIRAGRTLTSHRSGIHGGLTVVLDPTATTGPAPRSTDPNPLAKYGFGPRPKVDPALLSPPTRPPR